LAGDVIDGRTCAGCAGIAEYGRAGAAAFSGDRPDRGAAGDHAARRSAKRAGNCRRRAAYSSTSCANSIPGNLLLEQAQREVLERQLEFSRLQAALQRIVEQELILISPVKLSPLAFPLWAERIQSQQLRLEKAGDRIERLARQLEAAADGK